MKCVGASVLTIALTLAACVAPVPRAHVANDPLSSAAAKPSLTTYDYRRYIRGNVPAFGSSNVYDWSSPDPNHVVVWTSPAEAYLLTLSGACFGLQKTQTILFAANGGVVRAGAAAVVVG